MYFKRGKDLHTELETKRQTSHTVKIVTKRCSSYHEWKHTKINMHIRLRNTYANSV